MNSKLVLLFLIVLPLLGRPSTDVIVMKNHDRLTCEIKRLDKGVLYIGLDYVDGTVSVQWLKVDHVESRQLFLVRTQDGTEYMGALRTPAKAADEPVKIEVVESAESRQFVDQPQVVQIDQASENFWGRFGGEFDAGMTYTRGNDTRQLNLATEVMYLRPSWGAQADYVSSFSATSHNSLAKRNELSLGAQHLMRKKNWFYGSLGDFLQSSQQGIGLQSTVGGGVGSFLKNTNRTRISLTGGLAFQNTQYESYPTQKSIAGLAAANVQLFVFKRTALSAKANVLPLLNEPGRVRFNTNVSYSIQVISNLWWKFSFYGNWDTKPPNNLPGSDYGTTSSLSYTFGYSR